MSNTRLAEVFVVGTKGKWVFKCPTCPREIERTHKHDAMAAGREHIITKHVPKQELTYE